MDIPPQLRCVVRVWYPDLLSQGIKILLWP